MAIDCSKCKKCTYDEAKWECECSLKHKKVSHSEPVEDCNDFDLREERDLKLECIYLQIIDIFS